MANKKIDKSKIGQIGVASSNTKPTISPERFKNNLDKHFVNCARNNSLWEAFCEFKLKTENDEIFANSVKSPAVRKDINRVILNAFSKIDTSSTNYKYYKSVSKLKGRYKDGLDLFSNSYIETNKQSFMDDIMQEIIDRDISFLSKSDRDIFHKLFSISATASLNDQSLKLDKLSKLYDDVLPSNSPDIGKFSSLKVAEKFKHLNELCKRINNYETSIISSTAVNDPKLGFNEALDKFRLDLKKSCIPVLEVENMYHKALGIKPLDISSFIYDQEKRFVDEFKRKHPNVDITYSRPKLYVTYPFVKYNGNNLPFNSSGIEYVKKSFISENLKKFIYKLGGIRNFINKISLKILPHSIMHKKYVKQKPRNKSNNPVILKSRVMDEI